MDSKAGSTVAPRSAASELRVLLDSPEIAGLVCDLENTRWTGRPGYPPRAMVGVALAKSIYSIPTWTRTVALVREHAALREAIGGECPSVYAAYRFAAKLRAYSDLLDSCIARVLDRLRAEKPDFGRDLAIDASDLPAYANGQRYVSKGGRERERFSDSDASWGHRSAVSTRKGGGSTDTRSKPPSALGQTSRLRGRSRRPGAMSRTTSPRCSTLRARAASPPRRQRSTWATTTTASTPSARTATRGRSSPCARRPVSSAATIARRSASTGRGPSRGPTPRAVGPSGVARPASASPRAAGSRPTGCIRSSRARRSGGRRSTEVAGPSSASSDGSSCLLYTSPSPRDRTRSRMPSSA